MVSRGGWPGKGRPESTKTCGSCGRLFSSQWKRLVCVVLGLWIQSWQRMVRGWREQGLASRHQRGRWHRASWETWSCRWYTCSSTGVLPRQPIACFGLFWRRFALSGVDRLQRDAFGLEDEVADHAHQIEANHKGPNTPRLLVVQLHSGVHSVHAVSRQAPIV